MILFESTEAFLLQFVSHFKCLFLFKKKKEEMRKENLLFNPVPELNQEKCALTQLKKQYETSFQKD